MMDTKQEPAARAVGTVSAEPVEATAGGQARRRARTRAALLGAARELLAESRFEVSIQEITDRAGVGFGSFHNHFPEGKDQLFAEAVSEILDRHTAWVMDATSGLGDPVEIFALAFRLTGQLAIDSPHLVQPLLTRGLPVVFEPRRLRQAAEEVLHQGVESGLFVPMDHQLRLATLGGALLGMLQLLIVDAARAVPDSVEQVAVSALRYLGVPDDAARLAAARPLPNLPPFKM